MGFFHDLFYFIKDYSKKKYRLELPPAWHPNFSIETRTGNSYQGIVVKIRYTHDTCYYSHTKIDRKEGTFMLTSKDRDDIFNVLRPLNLHQVASSRARTVMLDRGSSSLAFLVSDSIGLLLQSGHGSEINDGAENYSKALHYLTQFAEQKLPHLK